LVGQCLLKLGILGVAAIFPAGEHNDQCSAQDGVGSVAGVAEWASPEIVEAFLCCGRLVRSKSLVLDR
jgi:hypothetical protein